MFQVRQDAHQMRCGGHCVGYLSGVRVERVSSQGGCQDDPVPVEDHSALIMGIRASAARNLWRMARAKQGYIYQTHAEPGEGDGEYEAGQRDAAPAGLQPPGGIALAARPADRL